MQSLPPTPRWHVRLWSFLTTYWKPILLIVLSLLLLALAPLYVEWFEWVVWGKHISYEDGLAWVTLFAILYTLYYSSIERKE